MSNGNEYNSDRNINNISVINLTELKYRNDRVTQLSEKELKDCACLFSENYGIYREDAPFRQLQPIKMSYKYYMNNYSADEYYVSRVFYKEILVGQAFYIRIKIDGERCITWVVQLVVDKSFRGNKIGSTLLNSIWSFSDDVAWGLATANPCTIKALEAATLRRCTPVAIRNGFSIIDKIRQHIPFAKDAVVELTDEHSIIKSDFYVDNSQYGNLEEIESKLGKLMPGDEWLCFTFQDQEIDHDLCQRYIETFLQNSEAQVASAYDRMRMSIQGWTKGTENEISYIKNMYMQYNGGDIDTILDLGCGDGRHLNALASDIRYGVGVDMSANHIKNANEYLNTNLRFINGDARNIHLSEKFSAVLCLYDVYGSYVRNSDNERIVETAYENLKPGGLLFLSAMNKDMILDKLSDDKIFDINSNPEFPVYLKPSGTMQNTGDIFNPEYLMYDKQAGLFYHKEQFENDFDLRAEYIIRDRRYTVNELQESLGSCGFTVLSFAYVQAGHFDKSLSRLDDKAKEIIIIAQK